MPLILPKTEDELSAALLKGVTEGAVVMLDPATRVKLTRTISLPSNGWGVPWGVDGNYAQITWAGPGGHDMIVYNGTQGSNRCLVVKNLHLDGGGYASAPCGACLKLSAPKNDGAIYKFTLRDVYTSFGTNGILLEGAVYEGLMDNCHAENHRADGILTRHLDEGSSDQKVVSNIQMIHPNSSRNFGAGINCTYSTNVLMGSFINNGAGGVVAHNGLRCAIMNNGENTGESVFVVPHNGFGSVIAFNEGSTDMKTVCRKYEGGQWVDVGKPQKYLLEKGDGVAETCNHVSTYGGATSPPVAVVKPAGK